LHGSPVGHHHEYSNLGIDLVAYIRQRVSRLPFHEVVRRRLLAPLGLRRTTFDQRAIAREQDRAVGHSARPRRVPLRIPMVGAGRLYTSVLDAGRFVQFHLRRGAPLRERGRAEEMCAKPFAHPGQEYGYGLGVISFPWDGIMVRGHSGGGFGFLADLFWAPEAGIGVVVLTSSVNHPLQRSLAQRVLTELAGGPTKRPATFLRRIQFQPR
jgi:CubicO group peptidase (beta-lactamase class C family)